MKTSVIENHLQSLKSYKYIGDYVESLDIVTVKTFLNLCGNPYENEADTFLRMIWELDEILFARNNDLYDRHNSH